LVVGAAGRDVTPLDGLGGFVWSDDPNSFGLFARPLVVWLRPSLVVHGTSWGSPAMGSPRAWRRGRPRAHVVVVGGAGRHPVSLRASPAPFGPARRRCRPRRTAWPDRAPSRRG